MECGQTGADLVLVALGPGHDGRPFLVFRQGNSRQHHRFMRVAQGITGVGVLQFHHGGDIAGHHCAQLVALLAVHTVNSAHPLPGLLGAVEQIDSRFYGARINPEE